MLEISEQAFETVHSKYLELWSALKLWSVLKTGKIKKAAEITARAAPITTPAFGTRSSAQHR